MNKKITKDELDIFLRKHKLWLVSDPDGQRADLRGADLWGADLRGADLRGVDLQRTNLRGADLRGADLRGANLRGADLRGADLWGADLRGADLRGARNVNCPIACPEIGSFTAFKKAEGHIVELLITEDSLRSSSTTRKCRCSKAKVMAITNLDGSPDHVTSVASDYDNHFIYTIGEVVEVNVFDTNRWNECAPGIHFFITRQEAVEYNT